MTAPAPAWRVLTYDIRDPARLRRLHARLKKQVAFLQESVALLRLDDDATEDLLQSLSEGLHPRDDLRIYRIDQLDALWLVGPNPLSGMQLGTAPAASAANPRRHR